MQWIPPIHLWPPVPGAAGGQPLSIQFYENILATPKNSISKQRVVRDTNIITWLRRDLGMLSLTLSRRGTRCLITSRCSDRRKYSHVGVSRTHRTGRDAWAGLQPDFWKSYPTKSYPKSNSQKSRIQNIRHCIQNLQKKFAPSARKNTNKKIAFETTRTLSFERLSIAEIFWFRYEIIRISLATRCRI